MFFDFTNFPPFLHVLILTKSFFEEQNESIFKYAVYINLMFFYCPIFYRWTWGEILNAFFSMHFWMFFKTNDNCWYF